MDTEPAAVDCYSGGAYATRPRAFVLRGERRCVTEVRRTWRTPGSLWFRVLTDRQELVTLQYDERDDVWLVAPPCWIEEDRP